MEAFLFILVAAIALLVVVTVVKAVRIVPQAYEYVVERFGRYRRTLKPGLNVIVPFVDRVRTRVDMREQVYSSHPQPVITSDNLVVSIDTVLYFRVTEPQAATYQISSFINGIDQLTVTTLRNIIGSMDLEKTLTSRDDINRKLQAELDDTTGKWGVKVTRVEIKAIEPPPSIRDAMEKQMRAERDRRAAILNAEGVKASQILTAEGEKQAAVLRADGDRQARILQAEGQAKAIRTVFDAIHVSDPDPKVLAYQYIQALPQIAAGEANKVWVVPAEMMRALDGIGGALGNLQEAATGAAGRARARTTEDREAVAAVAEEAKAAAEAAAKAAQDVQEDVQEAAETAGGGPRQLPGSAGAPTASVLDQEIAERG
jgi:regulator of protease activity HflC (stomatin/prohibitin superfamily)